MTAHPFSFLLPGARIDRRTTALGVYGADGALLPDCSIRTSSWTTQPPERAAPQVDAPLIFGPALFAGSVDKQFGFVLLNALGRLWALEGLPEQTLIVYAAKPQARAPDYRVVPAVLRGLGLRNPVMVTEGALRFEQLHCAEERFGECHGGTALPGFYDWLDRRWTPSGAPDPEQKVYVSRSGLGPAAGRFACEDHLETLLEAEGYRIYRPEAHDIAHQVRTFQGAGKLIFAEGSAVHLFALLRQPGQISAVIHRRERLPDVMLAQMADRPGAPTRAINAVRALWWPPQRGEHLGLSVLDFAALGEELAALGLISGQGWHPPTEAQLAASLAAGLAPGERLMTPDERSDWLKTQREARRKG
ncbi:glycosyltransferase family 61 protein [Rhodobacter sp. ETT8]|uniref:Glycosyltransferase family 61 protein n=2 Tax=Pseudotabrizicola algicola TaxID=2709381 RepID=A0A6B3RN11_9RHOB|nr:glycosyltransferase family 61 protein [Pseudotabrizicola algicola]NEX47484.1 glycosyltransferase family 61 protein [Pseudotabrizicola algicola]